MTGLSFIDVLPPEQLRIVVASLVVLLYLALCGSIWRARARQRRQIEGDAAKLLSATSDKASLLITFASQTGFAEELAWQSAHALHAAGLSTYVLPLEQVSANNLCNANCVLFIASTYGEGDAPDGAALFADEVMNAALDLSNLRYGLLALGDREYVNFCGFGRRLDAWLLQQRATPLFDRVEVDNGDEDALNIWRRHLSKMAGVAELADWQAALFQLWRLVARRHLNPGSAGGPVFHLELEPCDGQLPVWQAGDLVQILAPGDLRKAREYSIASLPADGRLHLLVRQERHADGKLGIASGWLTEEAVLGDTIELRLRSHRSFQLENNIDRPLLLIGNGTGLAGLRAHLKARAAAGRHENWLVFGERNSAYDFHYRHDIETWQQQALLQHVDLAFSRDRPERVYVQQLLRNEAERLREWLRRGVAIYVCGSLEGMAAGVDAALREIIGEEAMQRLAGEGRYRRDVY